MATTGVVAAGHPLTAAAGADVLRAGGNAVDAALAAMLTSFVAEPLLTGLGAGGYMLVAAPGTEPVLLDFFVSAPGHGADLERRAPLVPVDVSFGDAVQVFNIGASSCGVYGTPAGICVAAERFGTVPLADLVAPAAALARDGVTVNAEQAYVYEILVPIFSSTPEARAVLMPEGRVPRAGDVMHDPAQADDARAARRRRGGAVLRRRHRRGDLRPRVRARRHAHARRPGRLPGRAARAGARALPRPRGAHQPAAERRRHAARATRWRCSSAPAATRTRSRSCRRWSAPRTSARRSSSTGLAEPGFLARFMASRLGSTTHISVLDGDGWACSVTCTNGEGSGIVVPGTGVHVNNMMGEQDLSPLGFFTHPPGERLPSMMAPTVVLGTRRRAGAGARLGGLEPDPLRAAAGDRQRDRPRHGRGRGGRRARGCTSRTGWCTPSRASTPPALEAAGYAISRFRDRNLFFGGCQAVERDPRTGALDGGGDPRRGGAVVDRLTSR